MSKDQGNLQELWMDNRDDKSDQLPFASLGAVAPAKSSVSRRESTISAI